MNRILSLSASVSLLLSSLPARDSSLSVTLSSTIQANTIAIPANTPTQVDFSYYFDYMPEMTMTLEADGSFVRIEI